MTLSESEESKESDGDAIQQQMVTFHSDTENSKKQPVESSDSESDIE